MQSHALIDWGRPVPWFDAAAPVNPEFSFSSLGGRFILLAFIGYSDAPQAQSFLGKMIAEAFPWRDDQVLAFAVSKNSSDQTNPLVNQAFPKKRIFHDPNFKIAEKYGLVKKCENDEISFLPAWYVIDPTLRVYASGKLNETDKLFQTLRDLPPIKDHAAPATEPWAPVLMVPRVLSPQLCKDLIEHYQNGAPSPSGFMVEKDGKTIGIQNSNFKRRSDLRIEDEAVKNQLNRSLFYRLKPEIMKAFQFNACRIERYIVACYRSDEEGFFRPHRDNTTAATAHRRFAVTINLNAEEFEGGELRFPEFGNRTYKAPTGGAIVFSCSLLHEALPVTKGVRYATLPFLYDDAAAEIKAANKDKLDDRVLVLG